MRWRGAAGTPLGGSAPAPFSPIHGHGHGHGRRGSLYRAQSQTLFSAFGDDDGDGDELPDRAPHLRDRDRDRDRDGVGLDTLREVEDDELEAADERTALRAARREGFFGNGHAHARAHGSRSGSHTPR